jgi:hypothetical protein
MSDFSPAAVRESSWRQVEHEGLRSNPNLPLLDSDLGVHQSIQAIGARILCMFVMVSRAFGFPLDATNAWIDREGIRDSLSQAERSFLMGGNPMLVLEMQIQIESLYSLAWCVSLVNGFSVPGRVPDDLINCFPDLRKFETSSAFRGRLVLRPREELLAQLDAAYCFHWAWRDARLSLKRMRVNHEGIVGERRKALEWIMSDRAWDDVPLDT